MDYCRCVWGKQVKGQLLGLEPTLIEQEPHRLLILLCCGRACGFIYDCNYLTHTRREFVKVKT